MLLLSLALIEVPLTTGPVNLYTLIAALASTGVLGYIAVGYLSRYFTTKEDEKKIVKENDQNLVRLEDQICRRLDDLQKAFERHLIWTEKNTVTFAQFNGLGSRVSDLAEAIAEVRGEARGATKMAADANADIRHLTNRIEDVVHKAIDRLDKQVDDLRRSM